MSFAVVGRERSYCGVIGEVGRNGEGELTVMVVSAWDHGSVWGDGEDNAINRTALVIYSQ
jgi:hypothetical protein